ncbi:MAG: DUF2267 domain-containing protein [Burkholderiales bacterium]|nr:DUF2267 domain-containing protein [Burkholderiales bacterium]
MPIPSEYQRASLDFDKFMVDARDMAGLATTNMAWNMVVGVLHTFRRRLDVNDAIRFAHVLPPVLRAIFVADWDTDEPPLPFGDRATMTREVQSLRVAHNFAPDTAIHDVAMALRRHVNEEDFDRMLAGLPQGAVDFWHV